MEKTPRQINLTAALSVEGFVVKPVVVDQSISISGTLKPFDETVLMPDVGGRSLQ